MIRNDVENEEVRRNFRPSHNLWLGVVQMNNTYHWVDGQDWSQNKVNYSNWNPKPGPPFEPSMDAGFDGKLVVEMSPMGYWNDITRDKYNWIACYCNLEKDEKKGEN